LKGTIYADQMVGMWGWAKEMDQNEEKELGRVGYYHPDHPILRYPTLQPGYQRIGDPLALLLNPFCLQFPVQIAVKAYPMPLTQ